MERLSGLFAEPHRRDSCRFVFLLIIHLSAFCTIWCDITNCQQCFATELKLSAAHWRAKQLAVDLFVKMTHLCIKVSLGLHLSLFTVSYCNNETSLILKLRKPTFSSKELFVQYSSSNIRFWEYCSWNLWLQVLQITRLNNRQISN